MKLFRIDNINSGICVGIYEAQTPQDALDAMTRDMSGYQTYDEMCADLFDGNSFDDYLEVYEIEGKAKETT